jgi:hypothetical protein
MLRGKFVVLPEQTAYLYDTYEEALLKAKAWAPKFGTYLVAVVQAEARPVASVQVTEVK